MSYDSSVDVKRHGSGARITCLRHSVICVLLTELGKGERVVAPFHAQNFVLLLVAKLLHDVVNESCV